MKNKKLITTLLGGLVLLTSSTHTTQAKDQISPTFTFRSGIISITAVVQTIYRDITKTEAPWRLPNYIYHEEWFNGKLYKGWLPYSYSYLYGATYPPNSLLTAHYTGYLYST